MSVIYLDGRDHPIRVDLVERALEIFSRDPCPTFAPLRRVERVACWGAVAWSGPALLACARERIPICYLERGSIAAMVLSPRPPAQCFGALLEAASLHPDWDCALENWRRSQIIRSTRIALGSAGGTIHLYNEQIPDPSPLDHPVAAVRTRLKRSPLERRLWRRLCELLFAWVLARLEHEDVELGHLARSSARPNLPGLVGAVLMPLLGPAVMRMAGEDASRPAGGGHEHGTAWTGRCAHAFLAAEPMLSKHYHRVFRSFERMVRDLAEEIPA